EADSRERKPLGCNGNQGRTEVEDQPADSGDLTTDAQSPDQPTDAAKTPTGKAARRRHRMPLRKELATGHQDADEVASDEQSPTDEQPEPEVVEVSEIAE